MCPLCSGCKGFVGASRPFSLPFPLPLPVPVILIISFLVRRLPMGERSRGPSLCGCIATILALTATLLAVAARWRVSVTSQSTVLSAPPHHANLPLTSGPPISGLRPRSPRAVLVTGAL
eukprot:RCo045588